KIARIEKGKRHADHRRAGTYLGQRRPQQPPSADLDLHEGRVDRRDGRGRRRWRGAASAKLGPELERDGGRGGAGASVEVLHAGLVPAERPVAARAHGDMAATTG